MIMNAAFLISRDRESAFDAKVKSIASRFDKLTFKYTGPVAAVQLREHPAEAGTSLRLRMFILDSLLIGSLRFVLDKIVAAAEAEAADDTALREQLLEAQMQLELGEIIGEEFAAIERDVLARIREIRGSRADAITMSDTHRVTGVEVESYDEKVDG